MKKFVSLIIGAMMCLPLQSYAPKTLNQNSCIVQKYENNEFTKRKRFVENKLYSISSKRVFNYIMASPFVNDLKVSKRLFELADNIKADPVDLLIVMFAESSLLTTAVNDRSDATGLIGWMPKVALSLDTTVEELKRMTITEQLDEVEKYFIKTGKIGKINNLMNLYLAVFYPKAIGNGDQYVIGYKGSKAYNWNDYVDMNQDGKLTSKDLEKFGISRLKVDLIYGIDI